MSAWEQHKKALFNHKLNRKRLYMPLEISEFDDWEVVQPCERRVSMIFDVLGNDYAGSVLDVGCHTGFFCREFSRRGWSATGLEPSKEWFDVAVKMNGEALLGAVPPVYVNSSVDDMDATDTNRYDVALCLSVAMYFFRGRSIADGWMSFNRIALEAPTLFLDFGGQYAKHLPFIADNAVEAVVGCSVYTEGEYLGPSDFEGRPMFVFTRDQ